MLNDDLTFIKTLADRLHMKNNKIYVVYLCNTGTYEITELIHSKLISKERIKYITNDKTNKNRS